jgi:hypothetical protein
MNNFDKKIPYNVCIFRILQKKEKNMLKITTPAKAEELYEAAQEYPYPMVKRALAALKNGENKDAEGILEELLEQILRKHRFFLWRNLHQLIYRVILWKQIPAQERDGVWLTEIDKFREEIALLLYKNAELLPIFDEKFSRAMETALDSARIDMPNQEILTPSRQDIFETVYDWRTV